MNINRRRILQCAALAGFGLTGYSAYRGVRLPSLNWDPKTQSSLFSLPNINAAVGKDLIHTSTQANQDASFRAYAPEPKLTLMSERSQSLSLSVANIAQNAELNYDNSHDTVKEQQQGTNRHIVIDLIASREVTLSWTLPELGSYTFASIGDTGGDKELAWCLRRASELGAKFLLHLGDFNYQSGDYDRSIQLFRESEIPVYVSIGNHDFHDQRPIYNQFLKEIGPLNNAFSIANTRFANVDTAANVLPYGAGSRGLMFKQMIEQDTFADTVAFTHRPLYDPSEGSSHDMGSEGERDWLINALKQSKSRSLLSGHIHIYHRKIFDGIDNIIAGQGLGHQDLLVNSDYSKMVLGQVDTDGKVSYQTAPLAMPMSLHCHPRSDAAKESSAHRELIQSVNKACNS